MGRSIAIAVFGFALAATEASAHHSFASFFHMDEVTEIEGRVTSIDWVNPHARIFLKSSDGRDWELEAGPVNLLTRMGIERDFFSVGDTIRARGNPGRRNAQALWVGNILLADNTELLANPGAQPHWATQTVGDASEFFQAGNVTLPQDGEPSLFRVWTPLISGMLRPQAPPALTPQGERAQANYSIDNPRVADCEQPGVPFAMISPYPIAFENMGDRIVLRAEAYDLERVVYLQAPGNIPAASPLGYSTGRYEDNALIVTTANIDYHSYGDLGPAQSSASHIVERFSLSEDGLGLSYDVTVTDPVMLVEPWLWHGSFVYQEGAQLKPWDCGLESR
jgi:hypothetical protein